MLTMQVEGMDVWHPRNGAVYWEGPVNVSLEVTLAGERERIVRLCVRSLLVFDRLECRACSSAFGKERTFELSSHGNPRETSRERARRYWPYHRPTHLRRS